MTLPLASNIEIPILHELLAVGGKEDVRYLYFRLISYFPTLSDAETNAIKSGDLMKWKNAVKKAGKLLSNQNLIHRNKGIWELTHSGKKVIESETVGILFSDSNNENISLTHKSIQTMLVSIGENLGFFADTEFQYYDVVWRETANNQRLSHVFEVQSKGNLDSAFAKLKRAHDAQRSKIFLVLSTERDTNRAINSINREFRELDNLITFYSFFEIKKIHDNLSSIANFLPKLLRA